MGSGEVDSGSIHGQDLHAPTTKVAPNGGGILDRLLVQEFTQLAQELLAGTHANIGGEQDFLDLVEQYRIEFLLPREELPETLDPARTSGLEPGHERSDIPLSHGHKALRSARLLHQKRARHPAGRPPNRGGWFDGQHGGRSLRQQGLARHGSGRLRRDGFRGCGGRNRGGGGLRRRKPGRC